MGYKYTIYTFHRDSGKNQFGGYSSLIPAIWNLIKLKRLKHFGCIYLEIR